MVRRAVSNMALLIFACANCFGCRAALGASALAEGPVQTITQGTDSVQSPNPRISEKWITQCLMVELRRAAHPGRGPHHGDLRLRRFRGAAKSDDSPVTEADEAADALISARLREPFPDVALVTEEQAGSHDINARTFLIVDPLDGTKEFVQRRGDFTVNIALVEDGVPVRGIVYAPAKGGCSTPQRPAKASRKPGPSTPKRSARFRRSPCARPTTARYSSSRRSRTGMRRPMTTSRNTGSRT
jgi:fructose-1,6-bisphosphatase/inositol monophosphatase family enzyme